MEGFTADVVEKMVALLPKARLVYTLRDPLARMRLAKIRRAASTRAPLQTGHDTSPRQTSSRPTVYPERNEALSAAT